jgi:hypothetical protein
MAPPFPESEARAEESARGTATEDMTMTSVTNIAMDDLWDLTMWVPLEYINQYLTI